MIYGNYLLMWPKSVLFYVFPIGAQQSCYKKKLEMFYTTWQRKKKNDATFSAPQNVDEKCQIQTEPRQQPVHSTQKENENEMIYPIHIFSLIC